MSRLAILLPFALAAGLAFGTAAATRQQHTGAHVAVTPSEIEWRPGPESVPPGSRMAVLEGDPQGDRMFTWRLRFPSNYVVPPHTHPRDEHVTVLSGRLYMGTGTTLDRTRAKELPPGSFFLLKPGTPHFVYTTEETVLQLHSHAPWGITYVNPSDDPRRR